MDELDLIRAFRREDATPDPIARAAARERLLAHIAGARLVGLTPELVLECDPNQPLDRGALYAALAQPGREIATGVRVTVADLWGGLGFWLALREPHIALLGAIGAAADLGLVPALVCVPGQAWTVALLSERALAMLVRRPVLDDDATAPDTFELGARAQGPGGAEHAERLARHVRDWHAHGRPSANALRTETFAAITVTGLGAASTDARRARIVLHSEPRT